MAHTKSKNVINLWLQTLCPLIIIYLVVILGSRTRLAAANQPREDSQTTEPQNENNRHFSFVESLIGQITKTVIYGGATLAQLNSKFLCTILASGGPDLPFDEQPTLYVFPFDRQPEQAFKIYSDDDLSVDLIREARLNASQPTVLLIHGWLGGINNEYWLSQARSTILRSNLINGQVTGFRENTIVVDWSKFAEGSLYTATQNSLTVSHRLGKMLRRLHQLNAITPQLTHCIGHSIGAHICGQAARIAFLNVTTPTSVPSPWRNLATTKSLSQVKMGRITGLDPGGFCYELNIRNETLYAGLRPSDAHIVDAYYTNRSPFGNRYQVAHYNVRINEGSLQRACRVWRNSTHATEYFRATMRFLFGNIGHNDILTCDHYFATELATQALSETPHCSFVSYACDSYRSFVRGRCGRCETRNQCYAMDFEYQRPSPSTKNIWERLNAYSTTSKTNATSAERQNAVATSGTLYDERLVYFMRTRSVAPLCSPTYRIRVRLNRRTVESRRFRGDAFTLRLLDLPLGARESNSDGVLSYEAPLRLYGPWPASEDGRSFGLDNRTLTTMFELEHPIKVEHVIVVYDNPNGRGRQAAAELDEPVESIHIDYLSSTDARIKRLYSRDLGPKDFDVIHRRLPDVASQPSE